MTDGHWLMNNADMKEVCDQFGIGSWTGEWARLGGAFNDNLRITTDRGVYVVRISGSSIQEDQLAEIFRLSANLHKSGIPVPVPLITKRGEPYLRVADKPLQIIPYAEGQHFTGGEAQVQASGAMLRSFHNALTAETCRLEPAVSFFRPYEYCRDALLRLGKIERISKFGLAEATCLTECVYERWASVECLLPSSVVHGDWHFWNQLYLGDQVSCVVDLDYMQNGPRVLDIAYAMWMIHILMPQHADLYRNAFLAGYGALSPDEIEILPIATARIALFFLCHTAESGHQSRKWNKQYANQIPFIRWLLADGGERIRAAARQRFAPSPICHNVNRSVTESARIS